MSDSSSSIISPDLLLVHVNNEIEFQLQGHWTVSAFSNRKHFQNLQKKWIQFKKQYEKNAKNPNNLLIQKRWNLQALTQIDHIGAQLLLQFWEHQLPSNLQIHPEQQTMLERVLRLTLQARQSSHLHESESAQKNGLQGIDSLGKRVLQSIDRSLHYVELIGQLLLDVFRWIASPRLGPWRDFSGHLYQMGMTALPITALVGFLIGVVLAYLMSMQLRQFGAEAFIVNLLGISLIRELGPMLAAILVAGRSGSAITAQIGVMRVTEELDAMKVMGISHGFRLVMPRALALFIAMPLISIWTTLAALSGGMLAADLSLDIAPDFFIHTLPSAVKASNLLLAVSKSAVFGILIALVGCHYGLRVKPNTESLGQGTTASVVTAITMVIMVNAIFAILFRNVGV